MNICLAWDPAKRPTCVDVLQHPYFQARTASRRPLLLLIPTIDVRLPSQVGMPSAASDAPFKPPENAKAKTLPAEDSEPVVRGASFSQ